MLGIGHQHALCQFDLELVWRQLVGFEHTLYLRYEVLVGKLDSAAPEFDWSKDAGPPLGVGQYCWEAWAKIDGLERSLGRLDFEVVENSEARAAIAGFESLSEPERSSTILRWLVDHDFRTDAIGFARQRPQSSARDAFIAAPPGR